MKESTIVHLVMQNKTITILPFLKDIPDDLADSLIIKCENKMKKQISHDYTQMIDLLKYKNKSSTLSTTNGMSFFVPSYILPRHECGPGITNFSTRYQF